MVILEIDPPNLVTLPHITHTVGRDEVLDGCWAESQRVLAIHMQRLNCYPHK